MSDEAKPKMFTGTDFHGWKRKAKAWMVLKKVWKTVNSVVPVILSDNDQDKQEEAMSVLELLVSNDVMRRFEMFESANGIWRAMEAAYECLGQPEINLLLKKLHGEKKGSKSVDQYLQVMKSYQSRLSQSSSKISDQQLISYILAGLDKEWKPFVMQVGGTKGGVTMSEFESMFASAEVLETKMESAEKAYKARDKRKSKRY